MYIIGFAGIGEWSIKLFTILISTQLNLIDQGIDVFLGVLLCIGHIGTFYNVQTNTGINY